MSKLMLVGVLVGVVASAACSGDSTSSAPPTDPFVGRWTCSELLAFEFTSPPGAGMQMSSEMSTLSISAASGVLTANHESDGGANCKVSFTSNGSSATLSEGQTCTTRSGIVLTYKSGSATVNGSSMNSTFAFDASGNINVSGTMVPAMGAGTQASTCSRLTPPPGGGGGTTTGGW